MKLTKDQITEINEIEDLPYEQGIYTEPFGIPDDIKDPVLYDRFHNGGYEGGNCWNDDDPEYQESGDNKELFLILDKVLEILRPNITVLELRQLESMIHNSNKTVYEYYGNSHEYEITYIRLSVVEDFCNKLEEKLK